LPSMYQNGDEHEFAPYLGNIDASNQLRQHECLSFG